MLREVKFLARISHPNIIRYYNSWIELKSKDYNCQKFVLDSIVEEQNPLKKLEKESSFEILWDYSDDVIIKSSETEPQSQRKYAKSFDVCNEELNSISELTIFIQTEFCDETLEEYLDRRNAFLFDLKHRSNFQQYETSKANYRKEAHKILQQIIAGLKYIHNNCFMVHRDLKPSNIFLNRNLHVKLGDFGLSKQLQAFSINNNKNFTDSLCISPHSLMLPKLNSEMKFSENVYLSPEQLKELSIFDQRGDIYSLGVVVLRLFHPMDDMMEFFDVVKELKGNRGINNERKELSEILSRMMSEKQIERPNLQEIQRIFERFCDEEDAKNNEHFQNLGVNLVKNEGNEVFVKKWLKIINKKLYVFKGCEEKKAEKVYNLEECNLFMGKNNEFIAIEHPFQMGCVVQAIGKQGIMTEKLFQSFQELFENRDLKNFCFLCDKP